MANARRPYISPSSIHSVIITYNNCNKRGKLVKDINSLLTLLMQSWVNLLSSGSADL